jgi:hypothetical protein
MTHLYLPIFYILLQSKSFATYCKAIELVAQACNEEWNPETVTCDFEIALIEALHRQFPSAHQVLCYFHWKQALRKKLNTLNISQLLKTQLAGPSGLLEILTLIPISEIHLGLIVKLLVESSQLVFKGIRWIRSQIDESGSQAGFKVFWNYFSGTWMKRFPPHLWNIARHLGSTLTEEVDRVALTSRTNNALERYNQTLGNLFPNRPTVPDFAQQIAAQAQSLLEDIELINNGEKAKPVHVHLPGSLPHEYSSYVIQHAGEVEEVEMPQSDEMLTLEQYSRMRNSGEINDNSASALNTTTTAENPENYQQYQEEFAIFQPLAESAKSKRVRGRLAAAPKVAKKRKARVGST